jgi:hypothetical protein
MSIFFPKIHFAGKLHRILTVIHSFWQGKHFKYFLLARLFFHLDTAVGSNQASGVGRNIQIIFSEYPMHLISTRAAESNILQKQVLA